MCHFSLNSFEVPAWVAATNGAQRAFNKLRDKGLAALAHRVLAVDREVEVQPAVWEIGDEAEQPAPASHLAHPEGCDCIRYCSPCQPLMRAFSGWIRFPRPTFV